MNKAAVIAGVVVVAVAAYSGVSWYVGKESEDTIRAAIDRSNEQLAGSLADQDSISAKIEIADYDRGIFSSNARYSIIVRDGDETIELAMQDHMQHGPFPLDLVRQGNFAPMLAYSRSNLVDTPSVKRWFEAARGAVPLTVDTQIRTGGAGTSVWEFAPLDWKDDDGTLAFSGGRINVEFTDDFRNSEGNGRFESLVVGDTEAQQTFSLKGIGLESRVTTADDDSVKTDSALRTELTTLEDPSGELLTIERFVAKLESTQRAKLLDAKLRYDLERVRMGEIDLGSMTLGGELADFPFESFSALLSEYDAIAQEQGVEEADEVQLSAEEEQRLLAKLKPLMAAGPKAAVHPVIWRNEKGESVMSLRLAFQGWSGEDPVSIDDAVSRSLKELRFEVSLSRPMFLQAVAQSGMGSEMEMLAAFMFDQYVGRLEEEGLVQRDGDIATIHVVYGEGEVQVNGQGMSVDEFLGRYGDYFL